MPIDVIEGVRLNSSGMRMTFDHICDCTSSSYDGGLNPLCFRLVDKVQGQ